MYDYTQFMWELLLEEEMCRKPGHGSKAAVYQVVSLGSRRGPVVSLALMLTPPSAYPPSPGDL